RWARDDVTVSSLSNDENRLLQEQFNGIWRSITPRLTASWQVADNAMLYSNIARGTKPGDFNADVPDERLRNVHEESVWSYELGMKGRVANHARYGAAIYRLDVDDQQVTTLAELPDGRTASLLTNAGKTRVYGLETELGLWITDGLQLDLTYAWTDASYLDFVSVEQADLLGSDGSFADTQKLGSVAGNRLPRVAEHMASARLAWQHELPRAGRLYFNMDWSFESSRFAQEHNLIETGDRQLTNLAAGIELGAWDLTVWVRNLFDDRTPVDVQRYFDNRTGLLPLFPQLGDRPSRSPRGFVLSLPRGRQLGATLRLHF
ncbi:MAG TPA: TonB-dependent receptor, partial [Chromatiales bacterium]|nr:TonB-dependent receptor [Chromatiales bacterium]